MKTKDLQNRILVALRETGPSGLALRSLRQGLLWLNHATHLGATHLLELEGRRRIPRQEFEVAKKNAELRGIHQGQRCFIVGTGPSLQRLDLSKMKGSIVFGVNSLMKHPTIQDIQPRYYAIRDHLFFEPGPGREEFFQHLRVDFPSTQFMLPSYAFEQVKSRSLLPMERCYFVPGDGSMADTIQKDIDLTFLPLAFNILPFCVAIALYMGFREVILLGADHNWLAFPYSTNTLHQNHFDGRPSTFIPPNTPTIMKNYQSIAQYCQIVWEAHRWLLTIAQRNDQKIVNATPGSFLDVYPHVNYNDLFKISDEL